MTRKRASGWGGRREVAGGKPLPDSERRRHAALVRLSDAELAAIEKAAAGEPLATWIRTAALRAARRRR
jgi:hypothetical protein